MNPPEHQNCEPESIAADQASSQTWPANNQAHLQLQLERLRLLLHRRILWLRKHWQSDTLPHSQGMIITDNQADWLLTGADRSTEMRYYQDDPQAGPVTHAIATLDEQLHRLSEEMAQSGTQPAIEIAARLFGLQPFEQEVLLLCLAPELDPGFERLYGYVQDDVNRKYATPALALALFGDSGEDTYLAAKTAFHRDAPLRRYALIRMGPGQFPGTPPAASPLTMDERVTDFLQGVNRMDSRLEGLLTPMLPMPVAPSHQKTVERLVGIYTDQRTGWPVLNLIGPADAGKQALAAHLCHRLGFGISRLLTDRLPPAVDERREIHHLLAREAVLMPMAFYLNTNPVHTDGRADRAVVNEILQHLNVFIVLGGNRHWHTTRPILSLQINRPDRHNQEAMWRQVLENVSHDVDGHLAALVQQFDFGPRTITETLAAAMGRKQLNGSGKEAPLTREDLWQACREQAGARIDELARRITPCYGWEDIVLPGKTLSQLKEIAAQVAHRHTVYETWGFGAKLSRGRGISALFAGPTGTGKTMAAEILANHLGLDLFRIDLAGVVSKYIGETEKNLKKVFDAAEKSGAILFFDEADALFGKRTEVKDSHDRYANIEVNYLLQRMEDYRGLAILATNRKSALDRAFLRRLRFLVNFPFPTPQSRKIIWQKVFPRQARTNGLDMAALARLEISGGNIRNIALNAAFQAADAQQPIGMSHVMQAARREYAKIDKMMSDMEFGSCFRNTKIKGTV